MDKDKAREQAWSKTQRRWHKSGLVLLDREAFDDLFDAGYDARDAEDRWVAVEERLPETNDQYWVAFQYSGFVDASPARVHYGTAEFLDGQWFGRGVVVAYRPTPIQPYVTALSGEGE